MKAIRTHSRGGPERLSFEEAPVPEVRRGMSCCRSPIPAGVAEQHGVRGVFFIVRGNRGQLDQISALVDEGRLKPLIPEVLPLARAREAFEHGAANHAPGKIVLQVAA